MLTLMQSSWLNLCALWNIIIALLQGKSFHWTSIIFISLLANSIFLLHRSNLAIIACINELEKPLMLHEIPEVKRSVTYICVQYNLKTKWWRCPISLFQIKLFAHWRYKKLPDLPRPQPKFFLKYCCFCNEIYMGDGKHTHETKFDL